MHVDMDTYTRRSGRAWKVDWATLPPAAAAAEIASLGRVGACFTLLGGGRGC